MEQIAKDKKIVIITGSSGSGRKTIARKIAGNFRIPYVISYTTREPRVHEINNKNYRFISEEEFVNRSNRNEFLETVKIDRGYYGILKNDIFKELEQHHAIVLVLNREGALKVREIFGQSVIRIFIYLNKRTAIERLEAIKTPIEVIHQYMDQYAEEVHYRKECDFVFENERLDETIEKITQTMSSILYPKNQE